MCKMLHPPLQKSVQRGILQITLSQYLNRKSRLGSCQLQKLSIPRWNADTFTKYSLHLQGHTRAGIKDQSWITSFEKIWQSEKARNARSQVFTRKGWLEWEKEYVPGPQTANHTELVSGQSRHTMKCKGGANTGKSEECVEHHWMKDLNWNLASYRRYPFQVYAVLQMPSCFKSSAWGWEHSPLDKQNKQRSRNRGCCDGSTITFCRATHLCKLLCPIQKNIQLGSLQSLSSQYLVNQAGPWSTKVQ